MNTGKKIIAVLLFAILLALVAFSSLRVTSLTHRVHTLEAIVNSLQLQSLNQSASPIQPKTAPQDGSPYKVISVVDGDTIKIETSEGNLTVRVIGIDTPETVHPFKPLESGGYEASNRAKELLEGQIVTIHYDPDPKHGKWDKYERLLAYLDLPDGRDFGLVMITEGRAKAYPKYPFSRQELYLEAENVARQNGAGIWAEQADPCEQIKSNFLRR
jgi:micrococcal nuclease